MRLAVIAAVVAVLYLTAGAYNELRSVPPALPVQTVTASWTLGARPTLPWPAGAQAAVGVDGLGVLAATTGPRPLPIASVAKTMTALITLQAHPLARDVEGPAITITAADVQIYRDDVANDGSVVPVVAGEQLTEHQALQALLLPSANNVATLLARWVSGSEAAFVDGMNRAARSLGMTQTNFADASGFDPRTVSVPADLVILAQAAMAEPVFAQVVAQPEATLPVAGRVFNLNAELGQDAIVGIKTGNSDQARWVYLFAATFQPAGAPSHLVLGAVQGLSNLKDCFAAAAALVGAVRSALQVQRVVAAGQHVGRYTTAWNRATDVVATQNLDLLLWPGAPVTARLDAPDLVAPAPAGAPAGRLHLTVDAKPYGLDVATAASIPAPDRLWRLIRRP